jgi:invasion protein IalB
MPEHPSGNDPRTIWQNQTVESSAMTLETIRRKARALHAKTRRELIASIAAPLGVAVFSGLGAAIFDDPLQRAAFALALAWPLAGQFFLHRGMWSPTLPGDAA